jgi:hypothetical protein
MRKQKLNNAKLYILSSERAERVGYSCFHFQLLQQRTYSTDANLSKLDDIFNYAFVIHHETQI